MCKGHRHAEKTPHGVKADEFKPHEASSPGRTSMDVHPPLFIASHGDHCQFQELRRDSRGAFQELSLARRLDTSLHLWNFRTRLQTARHLDKSQEMKVTLFC